MSVLSPAELQAEAARLKADTSIADLIGETLQLERNGRVLVAPCPFHVERTPSFTVYRDHYHCYGCGAHGDVFAWLMRARRMNFAEAVTHLGGHVAEPAAPAPAQRRRAPDTETDIARRVELARRIWIEAIDPVGTPVERYLRFRGVPLPDAPVIRFHPQCPRREGALPAMVALMQVPLSGEPCGIHRTFLQPDGAGKAAIERPKAMLGKAAAIQLVDLHDIGVGLGLAEGIETALTCMHVIGWGPVWAAGTAGAIARFPVLRATTLNIFGDADGPGLIAARECAARWARAGEEVLIHVPPVGEDWNDAARRLAA